MKAPSNKVVLLKNRCPKCGSLMFTYWNTTLADHPEMGKWHVECTQMVCKHQHFETFPDLTLVSKVFEIENDT
jgi:ribosomal protein S27AE